jgi:ubiquinone/menaquinone biosynthesis C-methylase UbiE
MLSTEEAKKYYDKFGSKQDSQGFYEDSATEMLIRHGRFEEAKSVFEFGIGTGRFAEKLLSSHLASDSHYSGVDISPTMIGLARERLRKYDGRATVQLSYGSPTLEENTNSYDRFVSNYVLDLLSEQNAVSMVEEAFRILRPDGLLCMASLTFGKTLLTRMVSSIWHAVYRINAAIVGGCRPIELTDFILESKWATELRTTVSAFGITSEIIVARKLVVPA